MHQCKKLLAFFLVLTLVFQMTPLCIFAEGAVPGGRLEQGSISKETSKIEKETAQKQQSGIVVGEVTDLRGESQKHFRMNDGSFIAVDYGMPVHYTTDGGNSWTEIDNTLALMQANASQATKMAGQTSVASYVAENGDIATGFAADLRDGYLFSSKTGDYSLSMSLSDKVSFGEVRSLDSETAEVNTAEVTPDETESSDEAEAVETVGTTLETENAETVETTAETETVETADAAVETTEATDETETAAIEESVDKKEDVEPAESSAETVTAEAAKASDENRAVEAAKNLEEKEAARTAAPAEEPVEQFARSAAAEISYPAAESMQNSTSPVKQAYEEMKGKISIFGKEKEKSEQSIAEQVAVKKLYADVLYRNVYPDVDLRYALSGYNVKETIVVNQPRKNYSFTFYLDMQGLKPEQMKDGSIELRNERDEVVYLIPAPFMSDANGAESSAVAYKLAQSKSGAVQLTVIADEKWINDKERTFPVEIDPTLILYPYNGHDNILTSYVNSGRPNTPSYNNTSFLRSGYYNRTDWDSNCTGYTVGLIYFQSLPDIPGNCVVTDAQLGLVQVKYGGTENVNYHKLYATTIDTPSNPKSYLSQMTWNEYKDNILPKYAKFSGETTPTALDYRMEKLQTSVETMYVITSAVQRWYDEDDNSISRLLVLDDGHNSTTDARVTYGGYAYGTAYAPRIYVTYRNVVGIEGIYGYHTQNIGRAGTGYVNNYTLQPSLAVPIMTAPSGTLPFSISLYYNEGLSYTHFSSTNSLNIANNIHTLPYTNAKTGYGWKTSLQQTVRYAYYDIDGNYNTTSDQIKFLIYTDADGTEHYFVNQNNAGTVFKDEDGLGLTISTQSLDLYTMTDKENNTWEFVYGYLTQYTDNHGNKLFYAYDGNDYNKDGWKPKNNSAAHRVTGVWRQNDGGTLQKVATLTYNGNGYLSEIKDAANRTTRLTYDGNGCLTTLKYPDGTTATYSYSAVNVGNTTYYRILQACDNESNYRIEYAYRGGKPLQVANFTESVKDENSNWKYGQRVNCYLSSADHASFRYFDASDYSYEASDYNTTGRLISQHYFDSWGRTVNVVSQNPTTGELLGVSASAYTKNEQKSAKNNRLTNSASAGIEATNLLQNADFEYIQDGTPDEFFGWTKVGNGCAAPRTDSGTGTLVKPYHGKYLMKLFQWDKTDGDYRVQQEVYLEKNETYVFSAYVNTACTDAFGPDGNVFLSFLQKNTDGAYQLKAKSRVIDYKTGTAVNGGWERMEVAFTPTVSGTYAVAANVYNISAIAVFDNLKLEKVVVTGEWDANQKTGTASAFNLLQADSFEFRNASTGKYASTNVNKWWSYDTSKACPSNKQKHTGSYSLTFAPSVTDTRRATQTVQINASSNKTYILSGWGLTPTTNIKSSKEMEEDNKNKCRFFGLIAKVSYTDGSTPDYHYVSFNGDINMWQYASGFVVPKQRDKTVSTITVSACLDYCANRAYMDDISLIQEPVQTYLYDDNGNLTSATNSEGKTNTKMDSRERLTEYTAMNGVVYNLTYEGTSRQPKTIVCDGITTSYTYDGAGNATKTKIQAPNNGIYLESGAAYDETKNFQTAATDTNGNTSYFSYNTSKGLLTSSTDNNGVTTKYTYDANNNRAAITYHNGKAFLYYQYDSNGRLKQLNRRSYRGTAMARQGYHFEYDAWGNTTEIQVGKPAADQDSTLRVASTLATYSYDSTGKMTRMNYPSGQYVSYGYDKLDRLVQEVYYNSDGSVQAEYQYIYNADGQLAKQQAIRNGAVVESYHFEYDSLGRLIRSREENGSSNVQRTEHLYDMANRLTNQNWKVGDRNFKESYSYNSSDGTMASMAVQYDCGNNWGYVTDKLTYSYDALNRLTKVLDTENATQFYTRNYKYQDLSASQTTSRLAQFDYRNPSNENIIYGNSYSYDANGNITQINEVFTVGTTEKSRVLAQYTYDALNQLTKETRYTYSGTSTTATDTTVVDYVINTAGNLRTVTTTVNGTQTNQISYTYGNTAWVDKLTAVTVNGTKKTISYADTLNPKSWYNGTSYTNLTWTQGRRLSSLKKGNQTYSYEYDMSGVRSVKIADGVKHEYVTQNGRVVRDYMTNANTGAYVLCLDFTYDESGHPLTMRRYYNEAQTSYNTYHYVVNGQGDVVKLLHGPNKTVAEYTYDAWGNLLSVSSAQSDDPTIAAQNPLRYRGYYYDTETGFYYLQSRYYDPAVKRFLNADSYGSTGQGFLGYNMFSYCQNNPAVCIDNGGQFPIWLALFMDHVFGYIHRLVQMDIRLKHAGEGISIEQGLYLGDKSVARADVVDLDSGEIWEIKTVKSGRGAALDQLERYFKSNLKVSEKGPRAIPGGSGMFPGRFSGSFPLICGNEACGIDTYYVIYYTPEPGVILYDVRKAMLTQEEFANAKVYVPKFARQTSLAYSGTPTYATYATYAKYALGTACFAGACYCGYKLCEALLGCLMVVCLA